MKLLIPKDLKNLLARTEPCITIYTPILKDRSLTIEQFSATVTQALQTARSIYPIVENHWNSFEIEKWSQLVETHGLIADPTAEDLSRKTICTFISPHVQGVYLSPRPIPQQHFVADSFHMRPLLADLQTNIHYFVAHLSQNRIDLMEGDSQTLEWRHTFNRNGTVDEFIQDADRTIRKHILPSEAPLILVGSPKHTTLYRHINRHRSAIIATISKSDDKEMSTSELIFRCHQIIYDYFKRRSAKGVIEFKYKQKFGATLENLAAIAKAASEGRIKSLLIRAGSRVWGRFTRRTGQLILKNHPDHFAADDILDDIAETVLLHQGEVHVVRPDAMPTASVAAAVISAKTRKAV